MKIGLRRWAKTALFVVGVSAGTGVVLEAQADDWAVESDRRQQIIERYQQMLEENPVEGMALDRLLGYVGRGEGLNRLIAQYEARLERRPEAVNLRLILGHLYKAQGELEKALEQYGKVVELRPAEPLGWLGRGTVRLLQGERRGAMEDFEEALSRERNRERRQEILRQLGELSFAQREFDRGKEFFGRLVASSPNDQYLRMDYVRLLVQYRQFDEALEQYDVLLRLAGRDTRQRAQLLRDKADVLEMMDRVDDAVRTYEQALELVGGDSWMAREVRQSLVQVYRGAGRLDDFIQTYGQRWARGAADQQMLVADVYAEMGRLEDALQLYRRISARDRSEIESRRKAIRVLERLGRTAEIAPAYEDLIRAAPRRQQYAFDLATYYMRQGDRQAARQVLAQVASRFRSDSYVLLELADHYRRWNFDDEALQTYETVLRRESDDDAVLVEVGDFFFDRGERERAIDVWMRLPASQLGQRAGKQRMAEIFVERGIMAQGIATFEELLKETPDDERLLRAMARALERARRWDEAMESWERLLAVSTVRQRRQEARARIVELHQRQNTLRAQVRRWEETFGVGQEGAVEAGFFLVEAHLRLREFPEAEEVLRRITDLEALSSEERAQALLLLEQTYVRSGRYREAIGVLEELIVARPDMERELLDRMADHALAAHAGEEAVRFAARALDANPDDARAQARMGDIQRGAGNLEAAATHYKTAIEIDHRAYDAYLKLGDVLVLLERFSEAEDVLMQLVRNSPEDQLVQDGGERLLSMARQRGRLSALETQWAPLVFRMPVQPAHARLMMDLYQMIAGPLLLEVYHGDRLLSGQAQVRLYDLGGRATSLLVDQLQSEDRGQQARALRMVAEMEVEVAAPQVARLIGSEDPRIRKMAIVAAARLKSPATIAALERTLSDGVAEMRYLAIWALGHIDDPRAQRQLVELAESGMEGTAARLAWLGLSSSQSPAARRLILERLQKESAQGGHSALEMAILLRAAQYTVRSGQGAQLREPLQDLMRTRRDRAGSWAALVLAEFDDEQAAQVLWAAALSTDGVLARRGELALKAMLGRGEYSGREVVAEARFFEWNQSEFNAGGLLREAERSWRATHLQQAKGFSPQMERGLASAIGQAGGELERARLLQRVGQDLRGERAEPFWTREGAQMLAKSLLAQGSTGLEDGERLGLRLLAGEEVDVDGASKLNDDLLRRFFAALVVVDVESGAVLEALFLEGLSRESAATRQQALVSMAVLMRGRELSAQLAERVVGALGDEHTAVQLAAVRAAGQLNLSAAGEALLQLEKEASPTLRRAVRQARRTLASP